MEKNKRSILLKIFEIIMDIILFVLVIANPITTFLAIIVATIDALIIVDNIIDLCKLLKSSE